jgi:CubicO group peptidase (beta-lactamase class C family)
MRGKLTVLVWVSILWLSAAFAAGGGGPGWEADLQSYLDRAAEALEVPGAAVVVVTREAEATILTHGVRCAGGEEPVTPQTSFGIGSLTKAFTATAAATQVGDGVVRWDTRAQELIPELELADPVATSHATLGDLLAHRSGLGDHSLVVLNIDAEPAWLLPRLALIEPAGEFRDRFIYSGLGYGFAGEMLGRVEGASWSEVVSGRLLEPLGMASTTVGPPQVEGAETACGYHRWEGAISEVGTLAFGPGAPGNGLYSTAVDMARWLELLVGMGELDGRRIVDEHAIEETWSPQVIVQSSGPEVRAYGFGWYVTSSRGRRLLFHGGGGAGFTSQVRVFPAQGVAIAVLSNVAAGGLPDMVAERASDLVLGLEVGRDLIELAVQMTARIDALHAAAGEALRATADPGAPPALEIQGYVGCYDNPVFGRFEVRVVGDEVGAVFHGIELAVEHLHDEVFMLSSVWMGDLAATFTIEKGAATAVTMVLGSPEGQRVFVRDAGSCAAASPELGQ